MSQKIAFDGTPGSESFQLAGRRLLWAPVNTAMPAKVIPIYDDTLPTAPVGWADLGICVDSNVEVTVDYTVANIVTGTLGNVRRTYIDSQTGKIVTKIFAWEPGKLGTITGAGTPVSTVSTSLNRAFKDLGYGGTLGNKISVLVFEDFDVPDVEMAGASSYEQAWIYTPTAQRSASVNLSEEVTKTNVVTFDFTLLPFTNASFAGRSLLCIQRFLSV